MDITIWVLSGANQIHFKYKITRTMTWRTKKQLLNFIPITCNSWQSCMQDASLMANTRYVTSADITKTGGNR